MPLKREAWILVILCYLTLNYASVDKGNAKVEKENSPPANGNELLNCGRSNAKSTRDAANIPKFQEAHEAEKGAWPWMAEVYHVKRNRKTPVCGAVLISRSYVVTAGHCVSSRPNTLVDPRTVAVRLGEHDLESDKDGMKPVDLNVTSIHLHEEFDPRTFRNDIALLRLQHPVDFTKDIQPICLPPDSMNDEDLASRAGYVAGWGSTTFGGPASNVLIEMSVGTTNDEFCRDAYEGYVIISDGQICAVGVNGSSPCTGLGGAPLMMPGKDNRYYLVGIVSFGRVCGDPDYPDVYTRVPSYLDWIDSILNENSMGDEGRKEEND